MEEEVFEVENDHNRSNPISPIESKFPSGARWSLKGQESVVWRQKANKAFNKNGQSSNFTT